MTGASLHKCVKVYHRWLEEITTTRALRAESIDELCCMAVTTD